MRAMTIIKRLWLYCVLIAIGFTSTAAQSLDLPDTGISGVYEVMVGTDNAEPLIEYFNAFGFEVVKKADFSAEQAEALYGVNSNLTSYRLQNSTIDSHGLLRILEWETPTGPGVGYAPPETIGQRMAVTRTKDIFRINDVFNDLRHRSGQAWLATPPVFDDLYGMDKANYSISQRRVGVREQGVYGEFFNHVFFQRYGYTIPGYGTIADSSPLQASEFTHHDFVIKGDISKVTAYYSEVLGLKPEGEAVIDGDWRAGPRTVFQMEPGASHWYKGFVSPNNICGKLKFIAPRDPDVVRDRSANQRIGQRGITLHSFYTAKLSFVHGAAKRYGLQPGAIQNNEFGEKSFVFTGPDGVSWQILQQPKLRNKPVTKLEIITVNN